MTRSAGPNPFIVSHSIRIRILYRTPGGTCLYSFPNHLKRFLTCDPRTDGLRSRNGWDPQTGRVAVCCSPGDYSIGW
jgi:hypothetical protein